jgi:hypothetical protein
MIISVKRGMLYVIAICGLAFFKSASNVLLLPETSLASDGARKVAAKLSTARSKFSVSRATAITTACL